MILILGAALTALVVVGHDVGVALCGGLNVEVDDNDAGFSELVDVGNDRVRVDGCDAHCVDLLLDQVLNDGDFLLHVAVCIREGHVDTVLIGSILCAADNVNTELLEHCPGDHGNVVGLFFAGRFGCGFFGLRFFGLGFVGRGGFCGFRFFGCRFRRASCKAKHKDQCEDRADKSFHFRFPFTLVVFMKPVWTP